MAYLESLDVSLNVHLRFSMSGYPKKDIVVGIDASRNRSGGAKVHLIGILTQGHPLDYGIDKVHVWAYKSLLDEIPDQPWLIKHNPPSLEQGIFRQIWWQYFRFPDEANKAGCSIVLNTDAGTVSRFRPCITMSRDMLSYEPGEIDRFGFITKERFRLILLRYMQNRSLRQADGAIFLTRYAASVIQKSCGPLSNIAFIPHGVGMNFRLTNVARNWPKNNERPIQCLYISNADMYKHQWSVVKAIASLRNCGYNVNLKLVGGGAGKAQRLLDDEIANSDPQRTFVIQTGFVAQNELPTNLAAADIFIFASSCENMPNTLVEAMAVGLPIACSDRGPMPEVLADGGVYFDPEDSASIATAIKTILDDFKLRSAIAKRAKELASQYS
ncbi:glycosyltransferase, partial [bacterium]|nr:glycosyltransferase [bacterium]